MCLKLEFSELILKIYSLGVPFFFQICDFKFLAIFLLFTFFFEFEKIIPFFLQQNCQVRKIENQKNMLVGEGGLTKIFISKLSSNYVTFVSPEETKIKYIFTSYIYN